MSWEKRGKRLVYYRACRVDGEVHKEYFGHGAAAIAAADEDRAAREARQRECDELTRLKDLFAPLEAAMKHLDDEIRVLTHSALMAAGYHQHRGNWRKRRE